MDNKEELFLKQKNTLDTFLKSGAIDRAQYEKSLYCMAEKMGMEALLEKKPSENKKAYFAGGCFWCITPMFKIYGAESVVSGYSGGDEINPTYADVKAQKTGHRETICIEYDPAKVSYEKLLSIYLSNIDPYDAEGQYIDKGFSYTLAVYYNDEIEKETAGRAIEKLEKESGRKTAIALEKFKSFYPAEEYHQDYYLKNPEAFEKELVESGRKK